MKIISATCGHSKTVAPDGESPHSTTAPLTSPVGTTPTLRPAGELPGQYIRFGRFTSKEGLASGQVFYFTQDDRSFMWFGTTYGLNRYDGAGVKVYRHDPNDPHSLSQTVVRSLDVDKSGNVWVGT